jgi:hypothetical protein
MKPRLSQRTDLEIGRSTCYHLARPDPQAELHESALQDFDCLYVMAPSRILDLAAIISSSTATIHNYLASRDLPFPSFEPHASNPLSEELAQVQDAVLDATSELHDLLMPPINALHTNGNVGISKYVCALDLSLH